MSSVATTRRPHAHPGSDCPDQAWMSEQVRQAVAEFDSDPKLRHVLRNLARDYPQLFLTAALSHLESGAQSSADGFLAAQVLRQDSVFERLTDPVRYTWERAIRIFRRLQDFDPTVDFRLARMLPGRSESGSGCVLNSKHAARAIDILERISQGQRLLSVLGHLPNYPDPQISAKAALFISRRTNNQAWMEKQMVREDPRVRANALEGAWGSQSATSRRFLKECLGDPNNRVAGNALIGLHMAGCPEIVELAVEMSKSEDPARRSTAAWAMGKIRVAEFIPRLTALLRDESAKVKSAAIRSLVEIGRVETARAETARAAAAAAIMEEDARRQAAELAPPPEPEKPVEPEAIPVIEINLDGSSFSARRRR
jgi:hypothetical protein